jgi:hypothetical protein
MLCGGELAHDLRLIAKSVVMETGKLLSDYQLTSGDTIHLILRMRGD